MQPIHALQTILSKIKIKKQIYFTFIPIVILSTLSLGGFLTFNCLNSLYEQFYTQLESDNLRVKSILFDTTLALYNISDELTSDKELSQILTTSYSNTQDGYEACTTYLRFKTYLNSNTSISSLCIYTTNPTLGNSPYIKPLESIQEKKWLQQVQVPSSFIWEYSPTSEPNSPGSEELTLIRSFPLINSDYSAILVIRVSNNYLRNRIQNNKLSTSLSINNEMIFFSTIRRLQGTSQASPIDYGQYYHYVGLLEHHRQKVFSHISSLKLYRSNNYLYITTLNLNAYSTIIKIGLICTFITLMAVILPLTMIHFFSKYLSRRIDTLKTAMHNARSENYHLIDTFKGDDELSETFSDLKVVIEHVKEKEANIYKAQLKEQELINKQQQVEYNLLASQINPHFIYNTVETIRMMALRDGNKEVSTATKLFGKSMRYVLENTGTTSTTLDKELDYINVYLSIQKLRFNDRVNYAIEIHGGLVLRDYQILPLLLQPIIENAILHGLEDIECNGQIKITIMPLPNQDLCIQIFYNGKGITADELAQLNLRLNIPNQTLTSSIGLYNINQRIKLFYGSTYGMKITSPRESGTLVELLLPLIPNTSS